MSRFSLLLSVVLAGAGLVPLPILAQTAPDPAPETTAEPQATPAPEATAEPEPLRAPRVVITPETLQSDPRLNRRRVDLSPAAEAAELPVLGEAASGAGVRLLRLWTAEGRAAGLAGVFYDNRDGGHSRLSDERFPQLTHLDYAEVFQAQRLDRALADHFLFGAPVLGNASMAVTRGDRPRSLPRLAMTLPHGAAQAFIGYAHNHLYVYPGHRDYRDADILPATLPYFVVSRGSSRSDRPFLEALAMTLASFRPETRARLEAEGLLAPTLTMILRRGLSEVTDYLSPMAHPPVFLRDRLRTEVMMQIAQAMAPDEIPPLVRLEVQRDGFAAEAGLTGESERLFDTPSAVARLWRGWEGRRQMVVSAARTGDPNGRPLEFHWILLSGDPERVRIDPLDRARRAAVLTVDWHDAPVPNATGAVPGARVEIAVIAWNGVQYSAPALISVAFPAHEQRRYSRGPQGLPMLLDVDYDAEGREVGYDNVLWWTAPWRDEAVRDGHLRLVAWRRHFADGRVVLVTPAVSGDYQLRDGHLSRVLEWTPPTR